jgi:small ligand-binding sensory domain FIST
MRFFSAISSAADADNATEAVIEQFQSTALGSVDVAFVFLSSEHRDDAELILERLWLELDAKAIVGCSAEGVIGGDQEIERAPGLSVLAGEIGHVRAHPFHIAPDDWRPLLNDEADLRERLGAGDETRAIIGFGDPFTTPVSQLLASLDRAAPAAPLLGGMASSGRAAGENLLLRNDQLFTSGFVGVTLSGPIEVETLVSQGCRPIGKPFLITRAHENVIEQLGGRSAIDALREVVGAAPERDQHLLRHGLFVGRAVSEYRESFGRGDFLVRNVVGADEQAGTIAVADYLRVGQTVQFHVRDAATADEDLREMLAAHQREPSPAGALVFSCNGRGRNLFQSSDHDISALRAALPDTPAAGLFAAGEFGPVGGKNFIHGHTASLALLRARAAKNTRP